MKRAFCLALSLTICAFATFFTACKKENVNEGKTYYNFVMSETELTLDAGEKHGLICSYGDEKIIYTSSDDKVATVGEDGTVTAVSVGTAYITAAAENSDAQKICKVTVVKTIYTIGLDRNEEITAVVGAKLAFNATVYKDGEKTELAAAWSVTPSGLTFIADGNTATVTFSTVGEYTLKATYGEASATITVKVVNGTEEETV